MRSKGRNKLLCENPLQFSIISNHSESATHFLISAVCETVNVLHFSLLHCGTVQSFPNITCPDNASGKENG